MAYVEEWEIGVAKINTSDMRRLGGFVKHFTDEVVLFKRPEQNGWGTLVLKGKVEECKSKYIAGMVYTWCLLNEVSIEMNYVP